MLETDLLFLTNDFLMVLFFLVPGIEIKRELLVDELKDPARSIPVVAAALGGMLAPAVIYAGFISGLPSSHGWAFLSQPIPRLHWVSFYYWRGVLQVR